MGDWLVDRAASAGDIGLHAFLWIGQGNGLLSLIIVWVALVALGLFLSARGWLTVFQSFGDVILTLLLPLVPLVTLVLVYVLSLRGGGELPVPTAFLTVVCGALFVVICVRTLADNGEITKGLMALIIKIPLAVICAVALVELLSPRGGETRDRWRHRRATMGLIVLITGGLMLMLVRDKSTLPLRLRHG